MRHSGGKTSEQMKEGGTEGGAGNESVGRDCDNHRSGRQWVSRAGREERRGGAGVTCWCVRGPLCLRSERRRRRDPPTAELLRTQSGTQRRGRMRGRREESPLRAVRGVGGCAVDGQQNSSMASLSSSSDSSICNTLLRTPITSHALQALRSSHQLASLLCLRGRRQSGEKMRKEEMSW